MSSGEIPTPDQTATFGGTGAEIRPDIPDEVVNDEPPAEIIRLEQEAYEKWFRQSLRLREWYAKGILFGLGTEAVASLVIIFLLGEGRLHLSPWVGSTFFLSVFGQIAALARVVVRHLFPTTDPEK